MSPQKLKKLEKLAKVLDGGDVELLTLLDNLEEKTEKEIQAIEQKVMEAISVAEQTKKLEGKKGSDGYTPIKGKDYFDGEKGDDGYTPVKGVDYFDGEDGYTPVKGVDYFDGKDGESIKGDKGDPGKDGADGFIDEATIGYLEDELKRIDKKRGGYGQVIRKLQAGTGITIDDSNIEYPTITATGGGGAVDSVNTKTGVVVIDPDDLDDTTTTNKFVTAAEKTILSNTSGTNTGDQDISGIATNASAITGKQDILAEGAFVDGDKTKLDGIATGAEVNTIDSVTDTTEVDLTITAKALSASLRASSIDESKLDASVNASLDQADAAMQDLVDDASPTLGGDLDADKKELNNVDRIDIVGKGSTYTSTPTPYISQAGAQTYDFAGAVTAPMIKASTVFTYPSGSYAFGGGFLFWNETVSQNSPGVATTLGPYFTIAGSGVYRADGAAVTQYFATDFYSKPKYETVNGGTFNVLFSVVDYYSDIDVGAGVTVGTRIGFSAATGVVTGTLTNNIGYTCQDLASGTNRASFLYGTETLPAGLWGIYQGGANLYQNYFNANLRRATVTKTATYTATFSNDCIVATSGTWTLNLPAITAARVGTQYTISNVGAGTITVDPSGAGTVNGATTRALTQYQSITIRAYSTSAWVIEASI